MRAAHFFLLLISAALLSSPMLAETFQARVTGVDVPELLTLEAASGRSTARLYGIDAPEPGQPFSREALERVRQLTLGQEVAMEIRATDTAGVPVAMVLLPGGRVLQEQLLEEGLVWWDRINAPDEKGLRRLNAEALLSQVGIWSESAPVTPWDFRQTNQLSSPRYEIPRPKEEPAAEGAAASPPGIPAPPTPASFNVTREMLAEAEEYDLLTLVAQHQPRLVRDGQGEPLGLTASNLKALPLAAALGFQEGDVMTRVNGVRLVDEMQVFLLVPQFEDTTRFEVEVLRDGKPLSWKIQLPE